MFDKETHTGFFFQFLENSTWHEGIFTYLRSTFIVGVILWKQWCFTNIIPCHEKMKWMF